MFDNLVKQYREQWDRFQRSLRSYELPIRVICYVLGAGAFGVFVRWLQCQMAFDSDGLNERSIWNIFVPLILAAGLYTAFRFRKQFRKKGLTISEDFSEALSNYGKLYAVLRWLCGGLMCIGALALFSASETDPDIVFLRILALLGFLSGIAFPLWLGCANRELKGRSFSCLLAFIPILMFAVWLITSYKVNDINSVLWDFAVEMLAICVAMDSFFRMAGFVFDTPKPERSFVSAYFGAVMCIVALADERYAGEQMMFLSAAMMQALYVWILVANIRKVAPAEAAPSPRSPKAPPADENGFIHL